MTKMRYLEPETWEAVVARVARVSSSVTWAYAVVRDAGRLVPVALRVEHPARGTRSSYDYPRLSLASETLDPSEAAERLGQGMINQASGVGVLLPASRPELLHTPFAVPSDLNYGLGPPMGWPMIHLGVPLDEVNAFRSLQRERLVAPGMRTFATAEDAVHEVVHGCLPPRMGAYQIHPELEIRLADRRARLRSLVRPDHHLDVQIEEGTVRIVRDWSLSWTVRRPGASTSEYFEQGCEALARPTLSVAPPFEYVYVVLKDGAGDIVDEIEWEPPMAVVRWPLSAGGVMPLGLEVITPTAPTAEMDAALDDDRTQLGRLETKHGLWTTVGGTLLSIAALGVIALVTWAQGSSDSHPWQSRTFEFVIAMLSVTGLVGLYLLLSPALGLPTPRPRTEPFWRRRDGH